MAMFRNVMVYLGLGPDDEYDDGYYEGEESPNDRLDREVHRETMAPAVVTRPRDTVSRGNGTDLAEPPAVVRSEGRAGRPERAERSERLERSAIGEDSYRGDAFRGDLFREGGRGDSLGGDGGVGAVRPLRAVPDDPPAPSTAAADEVFFAREADEAVEANPQGRPAVQEVPQPHRTKPVTVTPQSFGDAKLVADEFRSGVPVIMNLQGVDRDVARRLIDFASGICYCLDGSMEKAAPQVFLLTPSSAVVSDDDRRRMEDRGYDR